MRLAIFLLTRIAAILFSLEPPQLTAAEPQEDIGGNAAQEASNATVPEQPAELQRLIKQHEQELAKLVGAQDKQEQTLLAKLRSDLKELQDKYTREALLDEAVAVRDCLRRLNQDGEFVSIYNLIRTEKKSLPDGTADAIKRFMEPAEKLLDAKEDSLKRLHESQREELKALFEKYTRAADLDSALAVRHVMTTIPAKKNPSPLIKIERMEVDLSFPEDVVEAERKYTSQLSRLQMHHAEKTRGLVISLVEGMKSEQNRATRAGKLDDAVLLRDLIKSLEAEPWDSKKNALLKERMSQLSADGQKTVDEFLKANQQNDADLQGQIKLLHEAFAPTVETLVKTALKEGDEEKSSQLMDRFASLLNLTPMVFYRHNLPTFSAEALKLIEPFEEATALRKTACVESEMPLRNRLVEGLRSMAATDSNQQADPASKAVTKAIEFFTADYTDGPQRGRLFVPDSNLPAAALELFNEYCRETVKLEQKLADEQVTAAKALIEALRPVREKHAEARQYLEAWTLLARAKEFERVLFETTVKFAHVPHWKDHLADAIVLDVRKNAVLLRQSSHPANGEWFPRGRIKFAPRDEIAEVKFSDPTPGPGVAVTDKTPLKRGQTVFYVWGRSALEATIVDLTETNVVLKYKERWHNETVLRTQLWMIEDY